MAVGPALRPAAQAPLRLPGQYLAPDRGEAHQRRLLRELALWH